MGDLFESEKRMQEWLSAILNAETTLYELLVNVDDFEKFEPVTLEEKKIYSSFSHSLKSLSLTEMISEGLNISLKQEDSLKPDFLLYAPETESIVIVELKNQKNATREGGTEIRAYASEIKSYIPFISDGDIISVIISPIWPTLIKHYIFHEIFWLQRNIICLSPIDVDGEIKLEILDTAIIVQADSTLKISYNHLGGYQLCLYDYELYKPHPNVNRLDSHLQQMKTSVNAMAIKGNSFKNHGFAFLWKDNWSLSLAPYSITIINFAPFQSIERFFHDETFVPNDITKKLVDIVKESDPIGHSESLIAITNAGRDFLEDFCEPRMEGFHTWDILKEFMNGRSELISFYSWGVFGDLYAEKLLEEYKKGNHNVSFDNPHLGMSLLDELIDPDYKFINFWNCDI